MSRAPVVLQSPIPNHRWLTVFEAAEYLQCSPNHIRSVIHDGSLRAARFANSFRIDRNDLDQLLIRLKRIMPPYRRGTHPWVTARHARARKRAAR